MELAQLHTCHFILVEVSHRPTSIQRIGKLAPTSTDRGASRNLRHSRPTHQTFLIVIIYFCHLGISETFSEFHLSSRHEHILRPMDRNGKLTRKDGLSFVREDGCFAGSLCFDHDLTAKGS